MSPTQRRRPAGRVRERPTTAYDIPLPRAATAALDAALRVSPIVILTGARQSGKSTLAQQFAERDGRAFLTLDDPHVRERARSAPDALLAESPAMVIDEVQREPSLVLALKRAVDQMGTRRQRGRFLVTGSANLLRMRQVEDSLAGRASYISLHPLARREVLGMGCAGLWSELLDTPVREWPSLLEASAAPAAEWRDFALTGGFPEPSLFLAGAAERAHWFGDYQRMYLDRDLRDLAELLNVPDFVRTMRATALRIGNLFNQSEMGRDIQLSQPQVHRYLNLLEISYQFVRLGALVSNRSTRLIKASKAYWVDTALAMSVAGETEPRGAHLENSVLHDLLVWQGAVAPRAQVMYWRTASGKEVDFVIELGRQHLPVEVKTSTSLNTRDAAALVHFLDDYKDTARGGLVLYDGARIFWLAERVLAVPWWKVV